MARSYDPVATNEVSVFPHAMRRPSDVGPGELLAVAASEAEMIALDPAAKLVGNLTTPVSRVRQIGTFSAHLAPMEPFYRVTS